MDPYLELWWRDVHHTLCTYARDVIQPQLGSGLKARVDERRVVEADELERSIYPDVRIVEGRWLKEGSEGSPGKVATVAEPETVVVQLDNEPARQPYIHIIDVRNNNQLINAIEFLSPSNKLPGNARDQYIQKQKETCQAGASLVEIDLVRTGKAADAGAREFGAQARQYVSGLHLPRLATQAMSSHLHPFSGAIAEHPDSVAPERYGSEAGPASVDRASVSKRGVRR
jgi:Protein of unknown function (DUF4058)